MTMPDIQGRIMISDVSDGSESLITRATRDTLNGHSVYQLFKIDGTPVPCLEEFSFEVFLVAEGAFQVQQGRSEALDPAF